MECYLVVSWPLTYTDTTPHLPSFPNTTPHICCDRHSWRNFRLNVKIMVFGRKNVHFVGRSYDSVHFMWIKIKITYRRCNENIPLAGWTFSVHFYFTFWVFSVNSQHPRSPLGQDKCDRCARSQIRNCRLEIPINFWLYSVNFTHRSLWRRILRKKVDGVKDVHVNCLQWAPPCCISSTFTTGRLCGSCSTDVKGFSELVHSFRVC